jgi:hypothetical protein
MKTFVSNLLAVSSLTALIVTSIPAVSAVAVTPAHNVARHLSLAHMAKVKRNALKKRCKQKLPNKTDSGGSSGGVGSGGSGGSTGGGSGSGGGGSGDVYSFFKNSKGLVWPNGCQEIMTWPVDKFDWAYNWRATPYSPCPPGAPPYLPMVWGWNQVEAFRQATNANHPRVVLFLNEANRCVYGDDYSACVSPPDAVRIWWDVLYPLKQKGTLIGASAPTSAPDGIDWERNFRNALGQRGSDFLCLHFYGTSFDEFIGFVNTWFKAFPGEPILFTEVGCQNFGDGPQCNRGMIEDFITRIQKWCIGERLCLGIGFFGAMRDMANVNPENRLINWDDYSPNDLGWRIINT